MEGYYSVVAPTGRRRVASIATAPPLPNLVGARLVEIWDRMFRGDEMSALLRAELRRIAPAVEIVEFPTVGRIHGADEPRRLAELPRILARERATAVLSGVAA